MTRLVPRTCKVCKAERGTMAFRWYVGDKSKRDYFHPHCYRMFMRGIRSHGG